MPLLFSEEEKVLCNSCVLLVKQNKVDRAKTLTSTNRFLL